MLLDADALKARHLAPQQVIQTIVAESYSIPGGSVQQAGQNLLLRTPGNFQTVEDVANLQIATPARRGARGRCRHRAGWLEEAGHLQPARRPGGCGRLRAQAVGHEHGAGGRARQEGAGGARQGAAGPQPGDGPGSIDLRPGELQRRHARAADRRADGLAGRVHLLPQPAQHAGDGGRPAHHPAGHLRGHVRAPT